MRRVTTVSLALSILLFASNLTAQQTTTTSVPNLIRYSGTLKDAQGTAVVASAPLGVTFAIYKQQEGGAPVWQETQNVTPDASGQYTVLLGYTTVKGLPGDLFSQQEERWLGVQVQGQAEQPRVLLVSVPYAFKAHEAETLGGLPPSAFVKAETVDTSNGPSGSTSSTAGNAASTTAPAKSPKSPGGPCDSPLPMYIPVFLDATGTLCNSQIFQSVLDPTGKIGIGTVNPVSKLDVNGDVNTSQFYKIHGTTVLSIVGLQTAPLPPNPIQPLFSVFVGPGAGRSRSPFSIGLNTFVGSNAGFATTTGGGNTFLGTIAGLNNTTGNFNTFLGNGAGISSTTSSDNTFVGFEAGYRNTLASTGAFFGYQAGFSNSCINGDQCGDRNTFSGYQAGYSNTIGFDNAFSGYQAGYSNTIGWYNTFTGSGAGSNNITGYGNTFVGATAGNGNTTGSNNIFIGQNAGYKNVDTNDNIYIGSPGAKDTGAIRIGENGRQQSAYIQGIYGASTFQGSTQVFVDIFGQLGTIKSSARFKEQVRDMGDSTSALMKLRPVTFLYKPEYTKGERTLQYGLIAEEVANVYPELVAYDNDGKPYSVRYQYLSTMLLNEVQKEHRRAEAQAEVINSQAQKISELEQRLSRLEILIGSQVKTAKVSSAHETASGGGAQ
jgi:hypothetical protein